jgi:peptide/nickel transport system permease protein
MAALSAADRRLVPARVPAAMLWGGTILTIVILLAIFGPLLSPYPYDEMQIMARLQPPSAAHLLGTDEFGRDVLSRTLVGTRLSLLMGVGATLISLMIDVPLGLIAGYYRGVVDETIMRIVDVMISVPPIMLGLLILAVTTPSVWKSALAVGIVYIPIMVRLTRSATLELAAEEFVEAARARGDGGAFIVFRELLPNAWAPIIVEAALRVTFAILLAAALSFLGLGVQPPAADWGLMIAEARPFIHEAPWIALAPGFALCVTVVAINLVGDGLREMLDPRMRRRSV